MEQMGGAGGMPDFGAGEDDDEGDLDDEAPAAKKADEPEVSRVAMGRGSADIVRLRRSSKAQNYSKQLPYALITSVQREQGRELAAGVEGRRAWK